MTDHPVIEVRGIWKIFGARAGEALEAINREGLGKPEVLERFGCVVGVQDASFAVGEEKLDPQDVAEEWVENNKETVDKWLAES